MIKELILDLEAIGNEVEDNLGELTRNLEAIRTTVEQLKGELKDEEVLD